MKSWQLRALGDFRLVAVSSQPRVAQADFDAAQRPTNSGGPATSATVGAAARSAGEEPIGGSEREQAQSAAATAHANSAGRRLGGTLQDILAERGGKASGSHWRPAPPPLNERRIPEE